MALMRATDSTHRLFKRSLASGVGADKAAIDEAEEAALSQDLFCQCIATADIQSGIQHEGRPSDVRQ
jgi:hypothetical protein